MSAHMCGTTKSFREKSALWRLNNHRNRHWTSKTSFIHDCSSPLCPGCWKHSTTLPVLSALPKVSQTFSLPAFGDDKWTSAEVKELFFIAISDDSSSSFLFLCNRFRYEIISISQSVYEQHVQHSHGCEQLDTGEEFFVIFFL